MQEQPGDRLVVPHPRWRERGFVQAPLADLWPVGAQLPLSSSQQQRQQPQQGARQLEGQGLTEAQVLGLEARLQQAGELWEAAGGGWRPTFCHSLLIVWFRVTTAASCIAYGVHAAI